MCTQQEPIILHQLRTHIRHLFRYVLPRSEELATELLHYYEVHEFDEIDDIIDDINSTFHHCCCKKTLFAQIGNSIPQKDQHSIYQRLRRCICDPPPPPIKILRTTLRFNILFQSATNKFVHEFHQNKEDHGYIVNLLKGYVIKQYDDIETIKDDINDDDEDNSAIIQHMIDNVNDKLFKRYGKEIVHETIINGLKHIVNESHDHLIQLILFIHQYFAAHFKNNSIGEKISKLFLKIVANHFKFDLDKMHDDITITNHMSAGFTPVIIPSIIKNINRDLHDMNKWNNAERRTIGVQLQQIVKGKSHIQEMQSEILNKVKPQISKQICDQLLSVMMTENFTFEDAVEDMNQSQIEKSIISNGLLQIEVPKDTISNVARIIADMKHPTMIFDLSRLRFDINNEDISITANICVQHCPFMYEHFVGVAEELEKKELVEKVQGKALCITKAIDIKNNKPWMYWILYLFSKERWAKYRNKELHIKQAYDIHDQWWKDNKYMRWIESTHPQLAIYIKSALKELVLKRVLPAINCDHTLAPVICDRVDDFALYALAFHDLVYQIQQSMDNFSKSEWHIAPIQLDVMIIPQMTKTSAAGKLPFQSCNIKIEKRQSYLKLSEEPNEQNTQPSGVDIWNIEDFLTHKKCGYQKGRDYFVAWCENLEDTSALASILRNLLDECIAINGEQRRQRYIFIIDRRNPQNLNTNTLNKRPVVQQKKTWLDTIYIMIPKRYRDDNNNPLCICGGKLKKVLRNDNIQNVKCCWCESDVKETEIWQCDEHKSREYVLCSNACETARPETHGEISNEWELLPEVCWSLSKSHMLFNPYTEGSVSITMSDALNGYMFGLSYHIFNTDNIYAYFCHNTGGTAFDLNNIETGWPQWFDTIDEFPQQMTQSVLDKIDRYSNTKKLRKVDIEQFEQQVQKFPAVSLRGDHIKRTPSHNCRRF